MLGIVTERLAAGVPLAGALTMLLIGAFWLVLNRIVGRRRRDSDAGIDLERVYAISDWFGWLLVGLGLVFLIFGIFGIGESG